MSLLRVIQTDERVQAVRFTEDAISVGLMDGRIIRVPLVVSAIAPRHAREAGMLGNLRRRLWAALGSDR